MSRNPLQQRLITIVEPVCQAAGYELVDLRFVLEQGGWTLRVAIDRPLDEHLDPGEIPPDRVDLIDCENLSRELSAVLDVEDPIPQAFQLEVSSPGIDRPLRTAGHFQHFIGSEAKIQLAAPLHLEVGDRRNFKGVLRGVEDGQVVIECDGTAFRLAIDDIDHAKLVPDWDAVMRGKSGVGQPSARPIKPGHRPSQKRSRERPSKHPDSERSETGGGDSDGFAGGAGGGGPRGIDGQHDNSRAAATSNKEQG
ncbi:MAG TPA: ribosome maturation factor RimP [Kofleriaceae bacterium]|nr:ribosome maturation factor RimP [Kofleriaceae bacterium]